MGFKVGPQKKVSHPRPTQRIFNKITRHQTGIHADSHKHKDFFYYFEGKKNPVTNDTKARASHSVSNIIENWLRAVLQEAVVLTKMCSGH